MYCGGQDIICLFLMEEIGKCQNQKISDSVSVRDGKFRNQKSEKVRIIGKCLNQKVSEYCRKVSELEIVTIGK